MRSEKSKTGLIISDHKIGGITVTLFESVFAGNDAVYGLTENAIDQAIETPVSYTHLDVYKRQIYTQS